MRRTFWPDLAAWSADERDLLGGLIIGCLAELAVLVFPAPFVALLNFGFAPYGQATYNVITTLAGLGLIAWALLLLALHHPGRPSKSESEPDA